MESSAVEVSRDPLSDVNLNLRIDPNFDFLARFLDLRLKTAFELPQSDLKTIAGRLEAFEARQYRLRTAVREM